MRLRCVRGRQPGVKRSRRQIVRPVRVKEAGQVLRLQSTDAELELSAAVGLDAVLLAIGVDGEDLTERAEAGGLQVDAAGLEGQRVEVSALVEGDIPGDSRLMGREHCRGVRGPGRVLEPGSGKRLGQRGVGDRVRLRAGKSAAVVRLQVHHIDAIHRRELGEERGEPETLVELATAISDVTRSAFVHLFEDVAGMHVAKLTLNEARSLVTKLIGLVGECLERRRMLFDGMANCGDDEDEQDEDEDEQDDFSG